MQYSYKIAGRYESEEKFEAREKWGDVIVPVRNQGDCELCWAITVAGVTGDRVGIAKGFSNGIYSPQDLISCDFNNDGCGDKSIIIKKCF
jgi:hypothetical protein